MTGSLSLIGEKNFLALKRAVLNSWTAWFTELVCLLRRVSLHRGGWSSKADGRERLSCPEKDS